MDLANFPPEILGFMLRSDYSYLAIRLLKTGSRLLIAKLHKGITELELWPHPCPVEFCLPLLSELPHLRRLVIYSKGKIMSNSISWSKALDCFPKSLESLEIDSYDAGIAFLNHAADWSPNRPSYVETPFQRGSSVYRDIGAMFPRLSTLEVSTMQGIFSSLLYALPSSLNVDTFSLPIMKSLPSSLVHVGLKVRSSLFQSWTQKLDAWSLNPNLECFESLSLRLSLDENHVPNSSLAPPFPIGLRRLDLQHRPTCVTPALVAMLPRTLTHLELDRISDDAWKPFWEPQLAAEGLMDDCQPPVESPWPPGLKTLYVDLDHLLKGSLSALPRTLTAFVLAAYGDYAEVEDLPILYASELPRNLSTFKLHTQINHAYQGDFPSSLTECWLEDSSTGMELSVPAVASVLFREAITDGMVGLILMAKLQRLEVEKWQAHSFLLQVPSASLTSIGIQEYCAPSEASPHPQEWFAEFPLSLTSLKIIKFSGSFAGLPTPSFARLPRLNSLEFGSGLTLPSSALSTLPRSMKKLSTQLLIEQESDLAFLPQGLKHCHLGKLTEADCCLPLLAEYWPPYARINLPVPAATKERIRQPSQPLSIEILVSCQLKSHSITLHVHVSILFLRAVFVDDPFEEGSFQLGVRLGYLMDERGGPVVLNPRQREVDFQLRAKRS